MEDRDITNIVPSHHCRYAPALDWHQPSPANHTRRGQFGQEPLLLVVLLLHVLCMYSYGHLLQQDTISIHRRSSFVRVCPARRLPWPTRTLHRHSATAANKAHISQTPGPRLESAEAIGSRCVLRSHRTRDQGRGRLESSRSANHERFSHQHCHASEGATSRLLACRHNWNAVRLGFFC